MAHVNAFDATDSSGVWEGFTHARNHLLDETWWTETSIVFTDIRKGGTGGLARGEAPAWGREEPSSAIFRLCGKGISWSQGQLVHFALRGFVEPGKTTTTSGGGGGSSSDGEDSGGDNIDGLLQITLITRYSGEHSDVVHYEGHLSRDGFSIQGNPRDGVLKLQQVDLVSRVLARELSGAWDGEISYRRGMQTTTPWNNVRLTFTPLPPENGRGWGMLGIVGRGESTWNNMRMQFCIIGRLSLPGLEVEFESQRIEESYHNRIGYFGRVMTSGGADRLDELPLEDSPIRMVGVYEHGDFALNRMGRSDFIDTAAEGKRARDPSVLEACIELFRRCADTSSVWGKAGQYRASITRPLPMARAHSGEHVPYPLTPPSVPTTLLHQQHSRKPQKQQQKQQKKQQQQQHQAQQQHYQMQRQQQQQQHHQQHQQQYQCQQQLHYEQYYQQQPLMLPSTVGAASASMTTPSRAYQAIPKHGRDQPHDAPAETAAAAARARVNSGGPGISSTFTRELSAASTRAETPTCPPRGRIATSCWKGGSNTVPPFDISRKQASSSTPIPTAKGGGRRQSVMGAAQTLLGGNCNVSGVEQSPSLEGFLRLSGGIDDGRNARGASGSARGSGAGRDDCPVLQSGEGSEAARFLESKGRVVLSTTNRINIKDGGASINSISRSSNTNIISNIDSINCRSNTNDTNTSSWSGDASFGSSKDSRGSRLQLWQGVLGGNTLKERPRQERDWQNGEGGAGNGVLEEFDDTILLKIGMVEPPTSVYGEWRFKVKQSVARAGPTDIEEECLPLTTISPNTRLSDGAGCRVCFARAEDALLQPCGHVYACKACARALRSCPICEVAVYDAQRASRM